MKTFNAFAFPIPRSWASPPPLCLTASNGFQLHSALQKTGSLGNSAGHPPPPGPFLHPAVQHRLLLWLGVADVSLLDPFASQWPWLRWERPEETELYSELAGELFSIGCPDPVPPLSEESPTKAPLTPGSPQRLDQMVLRPDFLSCSFSSLSENSSP